MYFEMNSNQIVLSLISIISCVESQCEFTTHQNTNGFCTSDEFCCKGFSVNNLCSGTAVCCYGSYDCSSDSSQLWSYLLVFLFFLFPDCLFSDNSDQEVDTPSPCPTLISRSQWKARNPSESIASIGVVDHIFIHHTDDGHSCYTNDSCRVRIRSLQSYHQLNKGWADIAWNFIIGIQMNHILENLNDFSQKEEMVSFTKAWVGIEKDFTLWAGITTLWEYLWSAIIMRNTLPMKCWVHCRASLPVDLKTDSSAKTIEYTDTEMLGGQPVPDITCTNIYRQWTTSKPVLSILKQTKGDENKHLKNGIKFNLFENIWNEFKAVLVQGNAVAN